MLRLAVLQAPVEPVSSVRWVCTVWHLNSITMHWQRHNARRSLHSVLTWS